MNIRKKVFFLFIFALVLIGSGSFVSTAEADHLWGGYHWARTANPFTLKLGDNLSSNWDAYLRTSSDDWNVSSVLDTLVVSGRTTARTCRPVPGRVEVCNSKYGANGWLGIASVWVSGDHITQGTVKMNDTYFNTSKYNTAAWKNLVLCQEVGHTFGLDHQDEDFTNTSLGTCMDYSNDPVPNQHPNQHDYDMLETLYNHLDSITTLAQTSLSNKQEVDHSDPSTWGREVRQSADDRGALYRRNLGRGNEVFTFVIWADEE